MPTPPRSDLGELALVATLLSVYLSARGTARALGAMQALSLRPRPGERTP